MNQLCRVCGEPAAGFHFGAFTCEGCKSFFGRTCNNVSSLGECKNGGKCVITRKNRTACKACRLSKCVSVGMSKSGSRYGRRSNWFKIHCLLQEQTGSSSAMSVEETKRILAKLKASNVVSSVDVTNDSTKEEQEHLSEEGHCASSPTVSSTEVQEPNTSHEDSSTESSHSMLFKNKTGVLPPTETLPLFAALSPFLFQPSGLSLSQSSSQLQAFSQYFPLLSLIATSTKLCFPNTDNSCLSSFDQWDNVDEICGGGESSSPVQVSEKLQRRHFSSLFEGGDKEGGQTEESDEEQNDTVNRIPINWAKLRDPANGGPSSSSNKKEPSVVITPNHYSISRTKNEPLSEEDLVSSGSVSVTKSFCIDRIKRSRSPMRYEESNPKRRATELLSFQVPEQDEPIDLSVKGYPGDNFCSSSPPVLACSMTVTPIDSCQTSSYTKKSPDGEDTSPQHEQVTSAVNLSCQG